MVIHLLRKGIFGMQLGKAFYEEIVNLFMEEIGREFGQNMALVSKEYDLCNRGFFKLSYIFLPLNYSVIIENEFRSFDIIIEDSGGASNVLNRIEGFDNVLDKKNIENSIQILKRTLEINDFNFYFTVDDKTYRKNSHGVKRVKDIKELLNG